MPRIDYLLGKDNKINLKVEELLNAYPILKEKKNILYVPTFRKNKNTHIYDMINAVDKNKYNLIILLIIQQLLLKLVCQIKNCIFIYMIQMNIKKIED